ncbi:MAG: leucine-rich repeat domain-containing protein [Clostridiales bacterium]|jgi:hypothetical protein|nr:leucine-rich repeat domain-containing protein [Clostridiales bacterium]
MEDGTPQCKFVISDSNVLTGYQWHRDAPDKEHTVFLPDEIEEIGCRALKALNCQLLVMPRSLKIIRSKAFESARIGKIDFNGSNLLTIESQAFDYCRAQTVLPDSVKSIGDYAVLYLTLTKGETLRLPSSLRHLGESAVNLHSLRLLEVDERLVAEDSGLEDLISVISSKYSRGLILGVIRDGKVVSRAPMPFAGYNCLYQERLIGKNGFNYPAFDRWFRATTDRHVKSAIAAFRFMLPKGLTSDAIEAYRTYVISNFPCLIDGFEEDIDAIKFYDGAGLITPYRLKQLLENARKKNNVEAASVILDLINRKSGSNAKSLFL